jgi:hypothetical protein
MAAVSSGPVLHAVLEVPMSEMTSAPEPRQISIVELFTGRERPVMARIEIWYDVNGQRLHQIHSVEGAVVADWLQSADGSGQDGGKAAGQRPAADPALAAFFKGYRHALADRTAAESGSGVIDGRKVKWLRFPATKEIGLARDVAVDAETYEPVLLRPVCTECEATPTYRIRTLEGVSEHAADFTTPTVPERDRAAVYDSERKIVSVDAAASALGGRPLWAGAAVDGAELSRVTLVHATRHSAMPPTAANEISRGRGLQFSYGGTLESGQLVHKANRPWVTISQSADYRHGFAGFNFNNAEAGQALTTAHTAVPNDGHAVLQRVDDGLWTVQFKKSGLYIEIDGSSRPLVLSAARSLRPVLRP